VKDVFFIVCDGLKDLPDSAAAVFPRRLCMPHQSTLALGEPG
jgi:hypothetical protein